MPVYEYSALDKSGKKETGIIDADSSVAARQKLRGKGFYPVKVKETTGKALEEGRDLLFFSLSNRVKPEEVLVMTRQLSTLLGAGIPLVSSLDSLIQQATNPTFKRIISQIKESVNEGNSLTHSLTQHPHLFSNIYINMVRAGEASGSLDVVLERLAEFSEHHQALKGRFRAALIYPVFMAAIGILVLFFLVTFIVPGITEVFVEMQQVLPLPTMLLIGFSNFFKSYWWLFLLLIILLTWSCRAAIKRPKGRMFWDEMKLRTPIVGKVNQKAALARFSRALGSLLQNGVPLLTSLQIVRNIVDNILIANVIDDAVEEIREGKSMAASFQQSKWFPPMAVQMISVGEQSGELEVMLQKIADSYEKEVESNVMGLTSMIEPVMILAMGLVVGFIVISILLPIFEMNQMIS